MSRRAFTMIEMLVALAATLLMMGATVTLFGVIVDSVSGSRALLEISDKLRATRNRIQADLQGATATMRPPLRPENDEGYLEIIEGPYTDKDWMTIDKTNLSTNQDSLFGDTDDVLMLTVRSRSEPFVGKLNATTTIESQVAEVMYFAVPNGPVIDTRTTPLTRLYTLYRRAFVVMPGTGGAIPPPATYYDVSDISAHFDTTTNLMVPNTLGDLTRRENRFAHYPNPTAPGFPNDLNMTPPTALVSLNSNLIPLSGSRIGDDILMTNVIAFNVEVFDMNAPVQINSGVALAPGDVGFVPGGPAVAYGAYVDLGYIFTGTATAVPLFDRAARRDISSNPQSLAPELPRDRAIALATGLVANPPPPPSVTPNVPPSPATAKYAYDTWSLHYENNGMDEDPAAATFDLATNGLDDGGINGVVDDIGERDTLPPYSAPLRGVRITIRVYEPSSLQVRQVTIVQDFLPE